MAHSSCHLKTRRADWRHEIGVATTYGVYVDLFTCIPVASFIVNWYALRKSTIRFLCHAEE